MQSMKPTRIALIGGVAGAALLGAVAIGGAAFAETSPAPTPSTSSSASTAPGDGPGGERGERAPRISGEVLTVSGSTVTVEDRQGFTRTIALADDVTVTNDGEAAAVSAIVVGEHISASGAVAADGTTLDATSVAIGEQGRFGGEGRGHGGPGGPGGRHGDRGGDRPSGETPSTETPSTDSSTSTS